MTEQGPKQNDRRLIKSPDSHDGSSSSGVQPLKQELDVPFSLRARLREGLQRYFGFTEFRADQLEVLEQFMVGRDVLATMPTGSGKSLLYQLPAAMTLKGVDIVISPLKALHRDQVDGLTRVGIPAAFVNSSLSEESQKDVYRRAAEGDYRLLFISPEHFGTKKFERYSAPLEVNRITVDEAHCVSLWGHDFRPDYLKIADVRERLFPRVPMLAVTATASARTQEDIVQSLRLHGVYERHADPDRPNIDLSVLAHFRSSSEKLRYVVDFARAATENGEPTIIYCSKIASIELVGEWLLNSGIPSLTYHGQMEDAERDRVQAQFLSGLRNVLVATKAFGMGIDKPDIRNIIHYEAPQSLEDYYQEVGRAGRDGLPAKAVLLYSHIDFRILERFLESENPNFSQLVHHLRKLWGISDRRGVEGSAPTFQFSRAYYIENSGVIGMWMRDTASASLALLERSGVIQVNQGWITLNRTVEEVESGKSDLTKELLESKRARSEERIRSILYYLSGREEPRQVILGHFRDNSIAAKAAAAQVYKSFLTVPDNVVKAVVRAANEMQFTRHNLKAHLRGEGENSLASQTFGALSDLTGPEVELALDRMESEGLVRVTRIKQSPYITVTEEALRRFPDVQDETHAISDYQALRQGMNTVQAKRILQQATQQWFEEAKRKAEGVSSVWSILLQGFLQHQFQVLDKAVSGQHLVAHYNKTVPKKIGVGSAVQFLNSLFDNEIPAGSS